MAEIPRKLLNDLTDELNALSAEGQRMVINVLENAEWSSVEELREIAIEAMEMVCGTMTDMAAARTAEFYDNVRVASVGAALGAEPLSGRVPEATQGAVRAGVQSVVEAGAIEQFGRFLTARVDYEIKRSSNECVYRNGQRDPMRPKYARVPSGFETCDFCMMLASRGPEDRNPANIKHAHANCDCKITQVYDGQTIEGYDEKECYDKWQAMIDEKASERAERNGTTVEEERNHIMQGYADASKRAKERAKANR